MKIDISIRDIDGEGYLCIKLADLTQLKRKRKTFTPPTIEEVRLYCKERRNHVNPVKWWNHYNAKNWMIGKTKMSNWKSAVVTWEEGANDNNPTPQGTNLNAGQPRVYQPAKINEDLITPMPESIKKKFGIKP